MLKQLLRSFIYISLILLISVTTVLSQVQQYIDTNFGDQGSVEILDAININNGFTQITSDSLANIYISSPYDIGTYSIVLQLNSEIDKVLVTKLHLENIQQIITLDSISTDIKVWPNPSYFPTNMLYARPPLESALLHIYDTNGKLIRESHLTKLAPHQLTEIATEDMSSGHYTLALIY